MPCFHIIKLQKVPTLVFVVVALAAFLSNNPARAANLDLAFGASGRFTTTMCGGGVLSSDVYVQPGGRVVYAGGLICPGTPFSMSSTGIVGMTSFGQLDPAFANAGKFLLASEFGTKYYLGSAMQPDGKLLVYYASSCPDCGVANYVLFRLTANGVTDPTFNAAVPSVRNGGSNSLAVALSADGKITVIHDTTPKSLIRFNPDGSRDQTFGSDGVKALPSTRLPNTDIIGMVIDERGKLSVAYRNGTVARFNSDGELDRSFGRQGIATEYLGAGRGITFYSLVRQSDGKLLFAGTSANPQNVILFRYTQRGRPDASFGTGGLVDLAVGPGASGAVGLALQPDGKIIVTGYSTANAASGVLMARFTADGTIERWSRTSFPDQTSSSGSAVAVESDGKIVASASAAPPNYIVGFRGTIEVLRFNDSNFGAGPIAKRNDFDGDGRTDLSVYRRDPAGVEQSFWDIRTMSGNSLQTYFGVSEDIPVPQDYNDDGKTDVAVFRPSNGTWYYKTDISSDDFAAVQFGQSGDIPIANDYDGDGKADLVVFRPSTTTWYIRNSSSGSATVVQFGDSGQTPVTGDFDRDGRADLALWNSAAGGFKIRQSSDGMVVGIAAFSPGDIPAIADFDGDGFSDLAAFTPSGTWNYIRSFDGQTVTASYGAQGDIPVPGDYSGDGKADIGVFRPSDGTWNVTWPTNSGFITQFGQTGDVPLPGR